MQGNMMGQNIIITERCQSLRQLGRNALRGKWVQAIMAVVIYTLVMNVPVAIFDKAPTSSFAPSSATCAITSAHDLLPMGTDAWAQ